MTSFSNTLQQAIFGRLTAQLPAAQIYDSPPNQLDGKPDSFFPFIAIGEDTLTPFDTDDSIGVSATITIHVWSRARGKKETKTLIDQIYTALNRQAHTLVSASYDFIDSLHEFTAFIDEADGKTKHGVSRFRVTMEKS